jgi:2-polyprenyl-6-methoxyphenol hydroxylase-like FAD-dependent oxidoreductase
LTWEPQVLADDWRCAVTRLGERAVVLGASMAGLHAARALADFYDTVTVVERDTLPTEPAQRRGVPQGRHVHALLRAGSQMSDQLFPGLLDELVAAGATVLDEGDLSRASFIFGGHELNRSGKFTDPRAATQYIASRPFLEAHVRRRLSAIANVAVLDGHEVVELVTGQPARVTGARVVQRGSGQARVLTADLIIDAMGRGARTPAYLEGLGYGRPREERISVQVSYASQLLRIPSGTLAEKLILVGAVPGRPTGGALLRQENDTWLVTLAGLAGHQPPIDPPGMMAFAKEFAPEPMLAAMRAGEPLGDVAAYRYPSSQWRRYDKMRRFPTGLLVVGDALCSFNPVYGQGMTVAVLEAALLRECLADGDDDLRRRFFRAAAKPIGAAWRMAVAADLAIPEVAGRRSMAAKLMARYNDCVLKAAESDVTVAEQFLAVSNLVDPPIRLLHPAVTTRVAIANVRRPRRPASR